MQDIVIKTEHYHMVRPLEDVRGRQVGVTVRVFTVVRADDVYDNTRKEDEYEKKRCA